IVLDQLSLSIVCDSVVVFLAHLYFPTRRSSDLTNRKLWNSIVAEAVGTYITLAILLLSGVIKPIPMQVIPITGMIAGNEKVAIRSEEHTSELQSHFDHVYRLMLEKKNKIYSAIG